MIALTCIALKDLPSALAWLQDPVSAKDVVDKLNNLPFMQRQVTVREVTSRHVTTELFCDSQVCCVMCCWKVGVALAKLKFMKAAQ